MKLSNDGPNRFLSEKCVIIGVAKNDFGAQELAYALEECGEYEEAEAIALESYGKNVGDSWAAHQVAHVVETGLDHVPRLCDVLTAGKDAGVADDRHRRVGCTPSPGARGWRGRLHSQLLLECGDFGRLLQKLRLGLGPLGLHRRELLRQIV